MSGVPQPSREVVYVANVMVPAHRARGLDDAAVARLAESMQRLGLRTPISVRFDEDDLVLVAGRHRLEAAKRLGWEQIEAVFIDGDEADARLWEISENLHRAELSAVERAEHIDEWRRLTVAKNNPTSLGNPGRPSKGHEATAAALGVSHQTVRNAERIASLPEPVREQAKEEGWSRDRLLDEARRRDAKPVPPPPPVRNDAEAEDAWLAGMLRQWNRAPLQWRERFLEEVRA